LVLDLCPLQQRSDENRRRKRRSRRRKRNLGSPAEDRLRISAVENIVN
jgi:hypothetical protein